MFQGHSNGKKQLAWTREQWSVKFETTYDDELHHPVFFQIEMGFRSTNLGWLKQDKNLKKLPHFSINAYVNET